MSLPLPPGTTDTPIAGKWALYASAIDGIGDGTIEPATHVFRMALFLAASNCADRSLSYLADLTHEHAEECGYTRGGADLHARYSQQGDLFTFTGDPVKWKAGPGPIMARYAVIYDVSLPRDPLLCVCLLDTGLSDAISMPGHALTVTPHRKGIFTGRLTTV